MKTKSINRKLELNKKTIVNLDDDGMRFVNGGATKTCVTCIPEESVCLICTSLCPDTLLHTECC